MGKFVKKFQEFVEERKESIKFKAFGNANFTLEQQYKLFFFALNGFAEGKPSKLQRLAWQIIPEVIDKEFNFEARERAKRVGKLKRVPEEDIAWIKSELIPYFENSLRQQKQDISELMFKEVTSGKINADEAAKANAIYSKNQDKFRSVLK
jgi:hypothetical protein